MPTWCQISWYQDTKSNQRLVGVFGAILGDCFGDAADTVKGFVAPEVPIPDISNTVGLIAGIWFVFGGIGICTDATGEPDGLLAEVVDALPRRLIASGLVVEAPAVAGRRGDDTGEDWSNLLTE